MLNIRHARRAPIKKLRKIAPGALPTDLCTKNVPKSRLGCPWARFCNGLEPPRRLLDGSWALLGTSWVLLGRVLDGSWASLGRSWVSPGCHKLPKRAPDSISEGSGSVQGRVGRSQGCIFRSFFIHFVRHCASC